MWGPSLSERQHWVPKHQPSAVWGPSLGAGWHWVPEHARFAASGPGLRGRAVLGPESRFKRGFGTQVDRVQNADGTPALSGT